MAVALSEQRVQVDGLEWFYREANPPNARPDCPPVVFLHGLVTQSYSWRKVLPKAAEQGFRAIAPDWIGHGFSGRPEKRDFAYTAEAFVASLESFFDALAIDRMHLIVQGFLGLYGLHYALRYPERVERLVILNVPLSPEAKLPWTIRRMALPLAGEMMTQDPLLVDRILEGGGPYQIADQDLDVYRKPFLTTSAAGRALLATLRNYQMAANTALVADGLPQWQQPTLLLWGIEDPWMSVALAEAWAKRLPNGELLKISQAGHYAQEDWAEKTAESILLFLKQMQVS